MHLLRQQELIFVVQTKRKKKSPSENPLDTNTTNKYKKNPIHGYPEVPLTFDFFNVMLMSNRMILLRLKAWE